MYLMYVDESGDPGNDPNSSPHFILSGLIISQDEWGSCLSKLKNFRKVLKEHYGLNQRTEIHASELIRVQKINEYKQIRKKDRINILIDCCNIFPHIFDTAQIINVCIKISDFPSVDIFLMAWNRILQRFNTYLKKIVKDKGIVITDNTDSLKLQSLQRKMRIFNPTPSIYQSSYNATIDNVMEDPFLRASHHSYFIQSVDVVAHLLYRREYPKGSLRKYGLEYQFNKLEPILLKEASKNDAYGIVRK